MFEPPDYLTNTSLNLSRVMDDIGIKEECVMRRRRTYMVNENVRSLVSNVNQDGTCFIFGSQTEGATTDGLNSDTDILFVHERINVIQDWKDWVPGKVNCLMIRDVERYPGHCKLQQLRSDAPLPMCGLGQLGDNLHATDRDGNIILKNMSRVILSEESVLHGPAYRETKGTVEYDLVLAFKCKTWPKHYKQWTSNDKMREWPTLGMMKYMKTTGCFIVKVAHRFDEQIETWRISTSLAERCLMFSLNITQIKCFVLLKVIVKTFIEPHIPDTISSYICKTLLFHCIENTSKDIWKEHNLLKCVHHVLLYMAAAVVNENCPSYFDESVNLFLGKVNNTNKAALFVIITILIKSEGKFLLCINTDNINARLSTYIIDINHRVSQKEIDNMKLRQYRPVLLELLKTICEYLLFIEIVSMSSLRNKDDILRVLRDFINEGRIQLEAARIFLPFICSYIGTVEVSKSIRQGTDQTPAALKLLDLSLHSDVTSSRLKFASYLYCTGQLGKTLSVLDDVEQRMTDSVLVMCGCHGLRDFEYPPGFGEREIQQEYPDTSSLAFCVMFSKDEIPCCPRKLQYELFKSTDEERRERNPKEKWMDLAVIDSLPYLYFLQYMTYRHLGQRDRQGMALLKLMDCVHSNKYLTHIETAWNISGQCMEYEGRLDLAFKCYRYSSTFRPNNNAVRWHLMRLKLLFNQASRYEIY